MRLSLSAPLCCSQSAAGARQRACWRLDAHGPRCRAKETRRPRCCAALPCTTAPHCIQPAAQLVSPRCPCLLDGAGSEPSGSSSQQRRRRRRRQQRRQPRRCCTQPRCGHPTHPARGSGRPLSQRRLRRPGAGASGERGDAVRAAPVDRLLPAAGGGGAARLAAHHRTRPEQAPEARRHTESDTQMHCHCEQTGRQTGRQAVGGRESHGSGG